jgi:hypothetical protein
VIRCVVVALGLTQPQAVCGDAVVHLVNLAWLGQHGMVLL